MRLVQRSLLHTGYFILKNGDIHPAFSRDLVEEGLNRSFKHEIKEIQGVLRTAEIDTLIYSYIKPFKKEHGIIPQNYTEELRTGFYTQGNMKQTHELHKYK